MRYNDARGANIKLDMVVRFSVCFDQPIQTTHTPHSIFEDKPLGLQPEEDRQTDRWTNKGKSKRASNQRSKQALAQASKNGQTRIACIIFISKQILPYIACLPLHIYTLNIRRCMFAFHQPGHLSTL